MVVPCVLTSDVVWLQMTLEEAIGYVASDELIEVNICMQFIVVKDVTFLFFKVLTFVVIFI